MKKINFIPWWPIALFVVALTSTAVESCNNGNKKPVVVAPPVTVDTIKHLPDVVLENKEMDAYSESISRRHYPKPKPGEPPPPPPIPANGCLLLDFDGQNIPPSMWNAASFTVAPSGLNITAEQTVFDRVVNYYATFNPYILITRDETVFNSYPQNKRRRIIITTSWEWFGSAGGVAYINSFGWFDDSPAFVFSSLLQLNAKNISDAAAHEGGHTLGCRHQSDWRYNPDGSCYKASEYLWGNFIMGASYSDPSPIWGIGPNSLGCTIIQNDTAVIFTTLRQ